MALSLPLVTRAISSRSLPKHAFFCSRRFSTVDKSATESWASDLQKKSLILDDQFNHAHLEQLYATLPTRRGRDLSRSPTRKATLPYGFHLAFFGGSKPEADLRPDGTDPEFSPPAPFARRVWAGGRMEWPDVGNGAVRKDASATVEVTDVRLRGFETDNPIVFVDQRWNVRYTVYDECSLVTETRTHAYLPQGTTQRPVKQGMVTLGLPARPHSYPFIRAVANLPAQVDFSFSYTPTPTTLFRFSALTFNGHYIHLNRHYAKKEKYEGVLPCYFFGPC